MKKFLNDSRNHLSANNIKIIEGIPYGLASIRPVKNLKSFPGKIRNVVFKTMKNEKRRKRKK